MGVGFGVCRRTVRVNAEERVGFMTWIDLLQWPAMVVTMLAAWLVASQRKFKRNWGFWLFLISNALWIAWGWS